MVTIDPLHLAAVIRKVRRSQIDDAECLISYLVCEIGEMLPANERNAWHTICQPSAVVP
jgi:hypothetical protein